MLVNIPEIIQPSVNNAGYGLTDRPVYIEEFEDGSGFAFNTENPSGVKYLEKWAFDIYKDLVYDKTAIAAMDTSTNSLYADFVKHGLINIISPIPKTGSNNKRTFTVWFHIANACNLSCSYCYIPKLMKAVDIKFMDKHFMDSETIEKATKGLFDFCIENQFSHLQIKFAGGEPTLNVQRINETCETAKALSVKYNVPVSFTILTNGVFIDDAIFETFTKYKFGVSISIDGDKDRHNEIRFTIPRSRVSDTDAAVKREGSWETIDSNIDALISLGIKPYILTTVTDKNYKYLLELVKYTISKKMAFRFSLIRDKSSHKKENLENELLSALTKVYDWLGENMPADMPIEHYAKFAEWNLMAKKQSVCGTCKNTMAIDQEGKVASCQMRMDKSFGNVNNENLSSIFNKITTADDNKYLVNTNAKSGDCSVCYWKFTCAGGCPEHTRIVMGTANSPSPWCHLYQGLLPVYFRSIARQIKRSVEVGLNSNLKN